MTEPKTPPDNSQPREISFQAQHITHSGPVPPAAEIARYEQILPGAADRIFTMAEQEQQHRHQEEKDQNEANARIANANVRASDSNVRAQDASIAEIRRGQWMAFTLGLVFLAITLTFGLRGQEIAASALGLGGVAAVATVFIKVRSKQ
ncbi:MULTISPECIES: DUF2335 domain-containing protein [Halomonas]|uniref:DUF2335 domain-containing protein n=1 Tax=Halomonas TaxID=2745 RepID=UPI001C94679C|nr:MULTISPECIES: DUF2335 domain-containing protein [Halomonas]MBY6208781.1 DUF2335 domain-containing protein [Halomonas sp. DP3Y7-2]MBY6227251.1 DUF2335 domain-containing protein [Halomonas sp. DP3Y7-1]MCA0914999.1 DUF2335 domain-containing protein [Halomonas denitrificans]